jgi:hypothetical protein
MSAPLPDHYVTTIRRLVRFAMVSLFVGLLLGLWSTHMNKVIKYGDVARRVSAEEREQRGVKHQLELPAGLMWETGIDLRLSHGHVILIGGVLPLCFAGALALVYQMGGGVVGRGTLEAFFWMYLVGGLGAMALIIYKGWHLFDRVTDPQGTFKLEEVHASMFFGSNALKATAYGLSHTIMAGAVGVLAVALWRAVGERRPGT